MEFTLPADYFPPDHNDHPFDGPRKVRAYDTYEGGNQGLQLAVYLLDLPLKKNKDKLLFETTWIPMFASRRAAGSNNWTVLRALRSTWPDLTHLKDMLPNASSSTVFKNTMMPIHYVVAARLARGGTVRELLVQFSKKDHENSAWIPEKFVPQTFLDDFWQRVEPDNPPDHD